MLQYLLAILKTCVHERITDSQWFQTLPQTFLIITNDILSDPPATTNYSKWCPMSLKISFQLQKMLNVPKFFKRTPPWPGVITKISNVKLSFPYLDQIWKYIVIKTAPKERLQFRSYFASPLKLLSKKLIFQR